MPAQARHEPCRDPGRRDPGRRDPKHRDPRRWDLYCRVVDNLGDAGIFWRLARQLSVDEGRIVRLLIDDIGTLAQILPGAAFGTTIDGVTLLRYDEVPQLRPDVLLIGFHAPAPRAASAPVRINYEYLSAEDWIDRFHGSPSPHADGTVEHFFYPGFSDASGGLPIERDLLARRAAFQSDPQAATAFLAGIGVAIAPSEVPVSVFIYPRSPIGPLLADTMRALDRNTSLRLIVPTADIDGERRRWDALLARLADACVGNRSRIRVSVVPMLPQAQFDRLLWSCALNLVRGEDSWIRAILAARPFLWQAYPQADDARHAKVAAFLARLAAIDPSRDAAIEACDDTAGLPALLTLHRRWNGIDDPAMTSGIALARVLDSRAGLATSIGRWSRALGERRAAPRLIEFARQIAMQSL